ncbi:MAG: hypothetical protein N2V72_03570 [Methanophagales archaeon]|nr:hypothetical protein [Methanophagales archaeon]
MAEGKIHIRDFPPFIRFELEETFRRKIFAKFLKTVCEVEVDISPEVFWSSAEEEFELSRYELIFGKVRGRILKTLKNSPLSAKEILERNPDVSANSIYHAIMWLTDQKQIKKKSECFELKKDYFEHVRVPDLAKIIDLGHKGERRKNALSIKELEMATYLWHHYERACERDGRTLQTPAYGRWYQNHFALARAIKEWARGDANIPQWTLIAIASFTNLNIEEREVVLSYCLPPGVKIRPYYKGRYKLPVEVSSDLDIIALRILMKHSEDGLVHPVKHKKEMFRRLYHTFGSFQSDRIPLSIREIIEYYYQIQGGRRNCTRIPQKMKQRWELLPYHERTISKIRVLETLFELEQPKRIYELISRSRDFLEDVANIVKDLEIGAIKINKRNDRPHYRSYLPKKVKENLEELKEKVERLKIENRLDFLVERERTELIMKVKRCWGEKGVDVLSNLALDRGVRDLDLARVCGAAPKEVRKILYEFIDRTLVTYMREETPELVEYYYSLSPEGIKNFLAGEKKEKEEEKEEFKYPFPEEFSTYQRRRLCSGVG